MVDNTTFLRRQQPRHMKRLLCYTARATRPHQHGGGSERQDRASKGFITNLYLLGTL